MAWLKEQGASVKVRDNEGKMPLDVAKSEAARAWLRANGVE